MRSPNSPSRSAAASAEEVADGFIKIAVENMANAIKKISVQRGYDVTRYALNCFGGAGGQHACLVADALGMTRVLMHPFSSLLSAYGMGLADIRATREQAVELELRSQGAQGDFAHRRSAREGNKIRSRRPGRACEKDRRLRASTHPLRGHRYGACGAGRKRRRDEARLRKSAQGAVRLYRPRKADGGRSRFGRSGWRRRQVQREEDEASAAPNCPRLHCARSSFQPARGTRQPSISAISSSRAACQRPRHHHRAAPDHRGRARLAGRSDREKSSSADARR